jgi:hypothetical protein
MLRDDAGYVLGVRVPARPVVKEQSTAMANAQFGNVFIQLDEDASVLAGVLKVFLRATQRDQRWLDRFDLQSDRISDLDELIQRPLVGYGEKRVLMPGIELLGAAGQSLWARTQRQIAQTALFEFGKLAANFVGRSRDHTSYAEFTAERDPNLGTCQPFLAHKSAESLGQLHRSLVSV